MTSRSSGSGDGSGKDRKRSASAANPSERPTGIISNEELAALRRSSGARGRSAAENLPPARANPAGNPFDAATTVPSAVEIQAARMAMLTDDTSSPKPPGPASSTRSAAKNPFEVETVVATPEQIRAAQKAARAAADPVPAAPTNPFDVPTLRPTSVRPAAPQQTRRAGAPKPANPFDAPTTIASAAEVRAAHAQMMAEAARKATQPKRLQQPADQAAQATAKKDEYKPSAVSEKRRTTSQLPPRHRAGSEPRRVILGAWAVAVALILIGVVLLSNGKEPQPESPARSQQESVAAAPQDSGAVPEPPEDGEPPIIDEQEEPREQLGAQPEPAEDDPQDEADEEDWEDDEPAQANANANANARDRSGSRIEAKVRGDVLTLRYPGVFREGHVRAIEPRMEEMAEVVNMLEPCKKYIWLVGHTSSLGSSARNKSIGLRRAQHVMRVLARYGIPESRVRVSGSSSRQAVADESTEAGRKRNRRVMIACKVP